MLDVYDDDSRVEAESLDASRSIERRRFKIDNGRENICGEVVVDDGPDEDNKFDDVDGVSSGISDNEDATSINVEETLLDELEEEEEEEDDDDDNDDDDKKEDSEDDTDADEEGIDDDEAEDVNEDVDVGVGVGVDDDDDDRSRSSFGIFGCFVFVFVVSGGSVNLGCFSAAAAVGSVVVVSLCLTGVVFESFFDAASASSFSRLSFFSASSLSRRPDLMLSYIDDAPNWNSNNEGEITSRCRFFGVTPDDDDEEEEEEEEEEPDDDRDEGVMDSFDDCSGVGDDEVEDESLMSGDEAVDGGTGDDDKDVEGDVDTDGG